jgi:endo-1,3-1,4-beta-glycanase ExoK
LVVIAFVQTVLFAGLAAAGVLDFTDNFDSFDETRWTKGDHKLGRRSYLDPDNVSVSDGNLQIRLPKRCLEGGEILSDNLYGYGSYSARMKLPDAPSSITGFFLYKSPDYESEIDIELYNDSSGRIMFTTYAGGARTHTGTLPLGFDPTAGFHEYAFSYDQSSITFYVDGQPKKTWNNGLPTTSMHLMVNAWFPSWLDGRKLRTDKILLVDRIEHVQQ